MGLLAATIGLGAFLLFQVQPIVGRRILPWFGGAAAVWTTCLMFFQVVLVGGYAYAHLVARHLSPRRQSLVHLALLGASVAAVLMAPAATSRPALSDGTRDPTLAIVVLLGA